MRITKLVDGPDLVHLRCDGEITQDKIEPGFDPMERALGPGCFTRQVLLNLEKTTYIDSSGIGWLITQHKHFLQGGGRLVLHSIPPMVQQVLHMLKMHLVLNLAANESAAKALLGESAHECRR